MGRIKLLLLSIVCVVLAAPVCGQGLGLATLKDAIIQKDKFSIVSSNVFLYRKSLSRTGSISHLKLGSPSFGLGTASPSATLEINTPIKFRKSILYSPRVFSQDIPVFFPAVVFVRLVTTNMVVASMNYTGLGGGTVTVNILLNLKSPSSISGPLVIVLKTISTTLPTRVGITYSDVNSDTEYRKIKWPSGDSPVFTRTNGFCDIVYLYWTGPNWTEDDPEGSMFGMVVSGVKIHN